MMTKRPSAPRSRLDDERLEELLGIAAEVFIEDGFVAASTNEIARRANCSKTTFYSRFPTKETLFIAVMEQRAEKVMKEMAACLPEDLPIETALRQFADSFLRIVITGNQVALMRVVAMESRRFPELAHQVFELGPKRALSALEAFMQHQIQAGALKAEDPDRLAEHFMSLIAGGEVRWFSLGFRSAPPRGEKLTAHRNAAVRAFLLAYGTQEV